MSNKPPTNEPASVAHDGVAHDSGDDGEIELLLREAGERIQPTPEMSQSVYGAVHSEWQSVVAQRTRRKRLTQWSMAAGVAAIAVGALLFFRFSAAPLLAPGPMASIVKIQSSAGKGNFQISANDGKTWRDTVAGEMLTSGNVVRTDSTTRVAVDFGGGRSVRMNAGTRVELLAANEVRLDHGSIYVDAAASHHTPLTIQTVFGIVEHLGTQYQVQVTPDRMTISVREGRVAVAVRSNTSQIAANERGVYAEHGEIAREPIGSHDPIWLWAMQAAPTFNIDNQTLTSFLDWVARETGRRVIYASPEARAKAEQLILRGSVDGMNPAQALAAVLATTQFAYSESDTVIEIR